jgi:hypothetical protein
MKVLDVGKLVNIDRYQKINIDARRPEAIYPNSPILAPQNNVEFLRQCSRRIPGIDFADRNDGRIYARIENSWTRMHESR